MSSLRNLVDRSELRAKIQQDPTPRVTISLYRYIDIPDPDTLRDELYIAWSKLGVLGRIYLAHEGLNAQLCVPEDNLEAFQEDLQSRDTFRDIRLNVARQQGFSFYKLTIKVKDQIVADGLPEDAYELTNTGHHIDAETANTLLEDEDNVVVVDMRNHYESRIGRFEKAWCPDVDTFKEQLPLVKEKLEANKDKKILMYCTGGIRCEKASAYLKTQGFDNVYQLEGGIIHYHKQCGEKGLETKFKGKNFVFDERGAEAITDDVLAECDQCGDACDSFTNCKNIACNLLFIQCEACKEKHEGCCCEACNEVIHLPQEEYRKYRQEVGRKYTGKVYKSRIRPRLQSACMLERA